MAPTRANAADIQAQTVNQQQANAQLASKIEQLKVQAQDLPKQEAKLAKFRQRIPAQPGLPSFIRELTSIADKSSVVLVSMEPQVPAPLTVTVPAAPVAPTDGSSDAAGTTTLDTSVPSGVMFVQAQVTIKGGYFNTEQFLTKLEGLKRSFLVTGFDIATDADADATAGDVTTNLQIRVFYAPTLGAPTSSSATATATN